MVRKCWPERTLQGLAFTHAALNIFTDFVFAIVIPVPMLWSLQLNQRTKAAVMVILSLGLFVCLTGLIRLPEIKNYGKTGDLLWDSRGLTIWFMTEFNTGIAAASMPALKPLFETILQKTHITGRTGRSTKYGTSSGPGNRSDNHSTHHLRGFRSPMKGGFSNLDRDEERAGSSEQYDEVGDADSSASQRKLVLDRDIGTAVPLGRIQKSVTTTVTSIPTADTTIHTTKHGW